MNVEPTDERTSGWEVDFPIYRVYFFEGGSRRMPGGTYPADTYTYRISGAHNVHQVLAWADANAQGRRFILYIEWDDSRHGTGLLQLCGDDPNRPWDPHRDAPDELHPGPVEPLHGPGHTPQADPDSG